MDQEAVVSEQAESGRRLIEALAADGFDVRIAFWTKLADEEKRFLYLASRFVDDKGPLAAYRLVDRVLRKMPDLSQWIDPWDIRVIGLNDSLAKGALELMKSKVPESPLLVQDPRPLPGMTRPRGLIRHEGSTLGGVGVEGAYIYPPRSGAPV